MKCPKCQSENADVLEDKNDEWYDLCLVCPDCGYDEKEQKKLNNGNNRL